MYKRVSRILSPVLLASFMLSGCAHQSKEMTGQQIGIVLGAIIGAALGNNNSSDFAGAVIGGAIGGAIGSSIGRDLDEADRLKAQVATQAALSEQDSTSVIWRSDRNPGVSGVITTVVEPRTSAATKVPAASNPGSQSNMSPSLAAQLASLSSPAPAGRYPICKKVTHLINVNGQERKEENQFCQQPDGSWSRA